MCRWPEQWCDLPMTTSDDICPNRLAFYLLCKCCVTTIPDMWPRLTPSHGINNVLAVIKNKMTRSDRKTCQPSCCQHFQLSNTKYFILQHVDLTVVPFTEIESALMLSLSNATFLSAPTQVSIDQQQIQIDLCILLIELISPSPSIFSSICKEIFQICFWICSLNSANAQIICMINIKWSDSPSKICPVQQP